MRSGKIWEGLKLPALADDEDLGKQEMKGKAEFLTAQEGTEGMPHYTHRAPSKEWRTYWFQAFKEIRPVIRWPLS